MFILFRDIINLYVLFFSIDVFVVRVAVVFIIFKGEHREHGIFNILL
jgi:hypothetical protein